MNFVDAQCKINGSEVTLTFDKFSVVLSQAKAQKLIDGNYNGKTVVLGIRPENISDDKEDVAKTSCKVTTEVTGYELLGAEVLLYFNVGGAKMTASVSSTTPARYGDTVELACDANAMHVFDKETELTITN